MTGKTGSHWVLGVFAQPESSHDFTFIPICLNGLLQPIFKKMVEISRLYLPYFKCIDIFLIENQSLIEWRGDGMRFANN
ncbi:hypothetical protein [Methylophilus sp. 14]|uniref:hypothetical protein n=1 Tax=Methylophilus sp. 14 TaxID=2781019 RepID=UPI00188EE83C|nr:hypothetical protein [Methylophilus sp. 14]MBF4987110.1 hypothetical protein [Methylophilus sp. 14]